MTKTRWTVAVAIAMLAALVSSGKAASTFQLREKDHIAIIGNTLAERLQYDGWLETMLHARFPKHDLVIRNLGFSGDEVATRLRSKNFGTPDEWLAGVGEPIGGYNENRFEKTNTRADVIFAFFGYNESFAGKEGVEAFKAQLTEFITHTLAQRYNGKSAPRLVLFSPIAHEDVGNPNLPDGKANNVRLEMYTRAMEEVVKAHTDVTFVDLFAPSLKLYAEHKAPLTIQGIHLNSEGNRRISEVIDRALFGAAADVSGSVPEATARSGRGQELLLVRAIPHTERLLDVRRSRVPDVRSRQSAQRQRRRGSQDTQGERAADQLRCPSTRASDPRRSDREPRPPDLGARPRGSRRRRRSTTATCRRSSMRETNLPGKSPSSAARKPCRK